MVDGMSSCISVPRRWMEHQINIAHIPTITVTLQSLYKVADTRFHIQGDGLLRAQPEQSLRVTVRLGFDLAAHLTVLY